MLGHNSIQALVARLRHAHIQDDEAASAKRRALLDAALDKMLDGANYGEATGAPAFLDQPEADFRAYTKRTNHDLTVQVDMLNEWLDRWFTHGEQPAPAAAWRICVLLRREKRVDIERDFLEEWCRHFGHFENGQRYADLVDRLEKLRRQ